MNRDVEIMILGNNLRKIRKDNRLSMQKMAKKIGVGVKSLSMLEKGILPPRLGAYILIKIHSEFGILPSELFLPLDDK